MTDIGWPGGPGLLVPADSGRIDGRLLSTDDVCQHAPVATSAGAQPMTYEIELDDELGERIERHLEDDETPAEFIGELLSVYETEGSFLQEGYSE